LAAAGLSPADLLNPASEARLRPSYGRWRQTAEAHLAAGWAYTNAIPRGQVRVRLACAWPILIGVKTLAKLREANMLDPNQRIKVGRGEVKRIMIRSVAYYPFAGVWKNLYATHSSGRPG
jgi:farnesyl-diphosphate farnesyltransferase